MPTPRRVIIAVVTLVTFIFLLRSFSSTKPSFDDVDSIPVPKKADGQPDRSYPPPSKPKKPVGSQLNVQDISNQSLREQLRFHFPYDVEARFPSFIWQTWKVGPSSGEFDENLRAKEASWTEKHPGFVHEVIADDAAEHLIKYLFSSIPDIAKAFTVMPIPVLKADFFRYLILLARGGIYSDIDTEALQSAVNWLPNRFDQSEIGLIVGIEADPDREDWKEWYSRRIQFCQWTIQSKPGHPILREIVARITEKSLMFESKGLFIKGHTIPKSISSVMEFTGPGVWTDVIFDYFNDENYSDVSKRTKDIGVADFFSLTEQKQVGDVVVLPITSFSPGVGQMGAQGVDDEMAFVHHDFEGSWKPDHERMKAW